VHIESLRLDDRLKVDWQVEVDPDSVRIPLLTLQPLLENAIYHGIQPLPEGGEVVVCIKIEDRKLIATISNPLPDSDYSHEPSNRMALDNIKRRLEAIYGSEASLVPVRGEQIFTTTISYPLGRLSQFYWLAAPLRPCLVCLNDASDEVFVLGR
jgi:two-component system sensor histidine kinase AlgZ